MCGRFANQLENSESWDEYFNCDNLLDDIVNEVAIGYNIAPTQTIPIVTKDGWLAARWGLVAPWATEISTKFATFNARSETVKEKATFKRAWNNNQRCVIPAIGYYEWKVEGNEKQPYFVCNINKSPMFFGGLYEPPREHIPASCTILTKQADKKMSALHPRVPYIFKSEGIQRWLQRGIANETFPEFLYYPVSKSVNNPNNQGSELVIQTKK